MIKVDDSLPSDSRTLTRKVVICEEDSNIIKLLHGVISTGFNCTPKIFYSDKEA